MLCLHPALGMITILIQRLVIHRMRCVWRRRSTPIVGLVLQVLLRYAPELRGKQDHKFISSRMQSLREPLVLRVLQVLQVRPVVRVTLVPLVLRVLPVVRVLQVQPVPLPVLRAVPVREGVVVLVVVSLALVLLAMPVCRAVPAVPEKPAIRVVQVILVVLEVLDIQVIRVVQVILVVQVVQVLQAEYRLLPIRILEF